MTNQFEIARERYKPEKVKYLLVAEAPPAADRFFYFERVSRGDSLFLETMKALYPDKCRDAKQIRSQKKEFLEKFKDDGFYLVDVFSDPVKHCRGARRVRRIGEALPSLKERLRQLALQDTPIILISSAVYQGCASELRSDGFRIVNETPIAFPVSGGQPEYRQKLRAILGN